MKEILFQGCGTAIATPFNENGINLKEFQKLLEFQIENQVDSIIVCGTTGEAATMSQEEKVATIRCAIETTKKRVPVIVGTGSNNTMQAIESSKLAQSLGADGLLIVTPYYNKCTQNRSDKTLSGNCQICITSYYFIPCTQQNRCYNGT